MFGHCLSMIPICNTCSHARNLIRVGIKHHGFLAKYMICRQQSSEAKTPRHIEAEPCAQFTTVGKLFTRVTKKCFNNNNKISVVGIDEVGIATIFTLIAQNNPNKFSIGNLMPLSLRTSDRESDTSGQLFKITSYQFFKNITNNVCMIDLDEDLLNGELIDLKLGSLFHEAKIVASKDPSATADSKICIVMTGTYKGKQEHPNIFVGRTVGIMKAVIPPLVKHSPTAIFIIASDPVDILSYVTWKLSGVPKSRVIGTGTMLDTARFRYLLSQRTGISPEHCHGYIIGEHGEKSLPVWSNVNIAGVPLKELNPNIGSNKDGENWSELHKELVSCDENARALKGYSAWSIALAVTRLCHAILTNSNKVMTISTHAQGEHTIKEDVFLSLPCVIGDAGVTDIVRQNLTDMELTKLRKCADNIACLQDPVKVMS